MMTLGPQESAATLFRQRLAGGLWAATVLLPAMYVPGFLGHPGQPLWFIPPWILIPILGSAATACLGAKGPNTISAGVFGAIGGLSCFWCAAFWASGSEVTSPMEVLLAMCAGGFPILVFYNKVWKRQMSTSVGAGDEAERTMPGPFPRRFIVVAACAFVALTVISTLQLNQLENREAVSHMFAPVASFYYRFGYWPAVCFTPGLGILVGCVIFWVNCRRAQR